MVEVPLRDQGGTARVRAQPRRPDGGAIAAAIGGAMLVILGACSNGATSSAASASPAAPGSFTVHMGGEMTSAVGGATQP